MASDEELLKAHIQAQAVASLPKAFLIEAHERLRRAYVEEYAEVHHNPTTLGPQRLFKLNQNRCFRADWELYQAATAHGLAATAKPLPLNKWHHTYVTAGAFGLTQSYVQRIGDLPQAAKFREALAAAAACPRLPLDDPAEIYELKQFYGLLAHTPVGHEFNEEHQKLGSLMLCVPDKDMKSWAASISVPELIALYPVPKKDIKKDRGPLWRRDKGTGTGKP